MLFFQEECLVAEVIGLACLRVEMEEEGLVAVGEGVGLPLVDGAEVMDAGVDGEADVGLEVGGAEPVAVEADVHFFGEEGDVGRHGLDDVDEGFAGGRLGWEGWLFDGLNGEVGGGCSAGDGPGVLLGVEGWGEEQEC